MLSRLQPQSHENVVITLLLRIIYDRLCREFEVADYAGIGIVSTDDPDEKFANLMVRALELLDAADSRRLARIQKHVRWIGNFASPFGAGAASYLYKYRRCSIDFDGIECENTDEYACYFAGLIVHEATHGELAARGFKYRGDHRERHERICCAEQNRALRRLDKIVPGVAKHFCRDFDATRWSKAWSLNRFQRFWLELQRVFARNAAVS